MLITKIFHLHQPLAEARARLCDLGSWDAVDRGMELHCSMGTGKALPHVELKPGAETRLLADLEQVPGDDPNRILFRSVAGNLEMAGLIELFEIRPNLTEGVLTLDYEPVSVLQKAFGAVDRFLNRQLSRLEKCVERRGLVFKPQH